MAVQIEEMNGRKKTTGWGLQTVPVQSNCKAIPLCYTSLRSGGQTSQSGFHNVLTPGCYYQFNFNKWKYLIAIFHFMPALTWWEDKKPQISQDIKYDPNHRAAQSRVVCCLGWYLEREGLPVAIWHQGPLSRRITRRENPFLTLKASFLVPTQPTQTKTAVEWIHYFLCLLLLIVLCMLSILFLTT